MQDFILLILLTRSSLEGVDGLGIVFNAAVIFLGVICVPYVNFKFLKLVFFAWIPYLAMVLFSVSYSADPSAGFRLFLQDCTYPAIMVCVMFCCSDQRQMRKTLLVCLFSAIVPIAVAMVQFTNGGFLDRTISGTFAHPNILAFYCLCLLFATYIYVRTSKSSESALNKRVLAMVVVVLLATLFITQTRSAWLAFGVSILLMSTVVERRGLFVLAILPLLFFVPQFQDRLIDLGDQDASNVTMEEVGKGAYLVDSYTWRKLLWAAALTDSEDDRLIGKGAGSFNKNTADFFPIAPDVDAHSAYIQTIYELGGLGLIFYVSTMLVPCYFSWRMRRINPKVAWAIMTSLVAYALECYSDNALYYLSSNWYVLAVNVAGLSVLFGPAENELTQ
jgi:O-Antigen ligase